MARETRSKWATSAREGGAPAAPTAPHGTDGVTAGLGGGSAPGRASKRGKKTNGPARFWDPRSTRRALIGCLVFSGLVHYAVAPWKFISKPPDIELKDVDDELTIPIEMLGELAAPPPPKVDPAPPPPTAQPADTAGTGADAGPPRPDGGARDAGPPRDAAVDDAATPLSDSDAGARPLADGGAPEDLDAGVAEGGAGDLDGAVAMVEAGTPAAPPSAGGLAGIVQGGPVNVDLLVNVDVIRTHPIGAKMGPLLAGIPQWNEFIHGAETQFDPIKHTNWIHIYGPSLIHTDRDAVHVHYAVSDAIVDRAIDLMSQRGDGKGGPFDAGVPGVRATMGYADQAPRVILRARPNEVVIVPPSKAADFAKVLKARPIKPNLRPNEAMRLRVVDPTRQIAIKQLKFPGALKELNLWVVPRNSDSGADLYGQGDCTDEAGARDVADALKDTVKQTNAMRVGVPPFTMSIQSATKGLLDNVEITTDGDKVRLHLSANKEQLEALLGGAAMVLKVDLDQGNK